MVIIAQARVFHKRPEGNTLLQIETKKFGYVTPEKLSQIFDNFLFFHIF